MHFIADFHIHSRFSMATSKDCNPENLHKWARWKGITLVGTGDCTHPGWMEELDEKLEPAEEEGLYKLRDEFVDPEVQHLAGGPVRFIVTGEISSIYKKNDRTRKVHSLFMMPSLDAAKAVNKKLDAIGNIRSDGRPILGLDARLLLEILLEGAADVTYVPAHIWTPHFSLFGAMSGFDDMEECYEDLVPEISAVESGLSSDPPMNWRLSALDNFALISNSDAHSPPNLGREANLFDCELGYHAIRDALRARDPKRFLGTLEFHPDHGKYHYDGHRKCSVCMHPSETRRAKGLCPECGKQVTIGVYHRVEELADRPEGCQPAAARHFESLVPLREALAECLDCGKGTKKVLKHYHALVRAVGSEFAVLRTADLAQIEETAGPLVAEGIRRIREGEMHMEPGFDGQYGVVRMFKEGERAEIEAGGNLFGESLAVDEPQKRAPAAVPGEEDEAPFVLKAQVPPALVDPMDQLNGEQRAAVECAAGPVIVVAGPGTGKTQTLTCRAAHLVKQRGVDPSKIMAVTFTNKAADGLRQRLEQMLGDGACDATVGTFHSICLDLLQRRSQEPVNVLDRLDAEAVMAEALSGLKTRRRAAGALRDVSLAKAYGLAPDSPDVDAKLRPIYEAYQARLKSYAALDYDDLLLEALWLLESEPRGLDDVRARCEHLLVDEFQDVNAVQYALVKLLAGHGQGLFVIGDPDQAIYGFRGADHRFFAQLAEDFPTSRRIALRLNYRSTPTILQAAGGVMAGDREQAGAQIQATREGRWLPRHFTVVSEKAEGIAVVREIARLVGGATMLEAHGEREDRVREGMERRSWGFSDIAVLFRASRQADVLEECFLREGVPYRVVGQRSFLETPAVRDALTFLRCVVASGDRFRFAQCLGIERFGIGKRRLTHLRRTASSAAPGGEEAAPDEAWVREHGGEDLRPLLAALDDWRARLPGLKPCDALALWMEEADLQADADLKRLLHVAAAFDDLDGFLNRVLLSQDVECERYSSAQLEAVTLMTLHAAKGLEFPVVFIVGCEEGLMPMRGGAVPEERRLLYVGMTRAQDELILMSAKSRKARGKAGKPEPSRFLDDIPDELLERIEVKLKRKAKDQQIRLF